MSEGRTLASPPTQMTMGTSDGPRVDHSTGTSVGPPVEWSTGSVVGGPRRGRRMSRMTGRPIYPPRRNPGRGKPPGHVKPPGPDNAPGRVNPPGPVNILGPSDPAGPDNLPGPVNTPTGCLAHTPDSKLFDLHTRKPSSTATSALEPQSESSHRAEKRYVNDLKSIFSNYVSTENRRHRLGETQEDSQPMPCKKRTTKNQTSRSHTHW